jgi:hypothetical protein
MILDQLKKNLFNGSMSYKKLEHLQMRNNTERRV